MERLQTPEEDNIDYFESFKNWAPDSDTRHTYALKAADPEYDNIDTGNMPTRHQGYNILLANWNSTESKLKHTYRCFQELSLSVASASIGEPVIVCEPAPLHELESIHQKPKPIALERSSQLRIGYLLSHALDFQYRSKLDSSGKGVGNIKPPYLLAAARLQLAYVEQVRFDIGSQQREPFQAQEKVRAIALGSTLRADRDIYRQQNFAEANPVLIGNEACEGFIKQLKNEYCISG